MGALRAEGPRLASFGDSPQVAGQRLPLAHGVDSRLVPRVAVHGRDVAGREHLRVRDGLQRVAQTDESVVRQRQAGVAQPGCGARFGDPQDLVHGVSVAASADERAVRHAADRLARVHAHAPGRKDVPQTAAGPRMEPGEYLRRIGEQAALHAAGVLSPSRRGEGVAQPAMRGERQFHPAGSAADDGDADRAAAPADALEQRLPAGDELADWLDRNDPVGPSAGEPGRRADVDAQIVERHRRTPLAQDALPFQVEADAAGAVEPRAGERRQRTEVDVGLVEPVEPGDETRQHARVRGVDVPRDQGEADARDRLHAERPQHGQMAVPAAEQHQVRLDGAAVH